MKIKILKSSGWYRNFVGSEFEVDEYDKDHTRLPFKISGMGWVYESDCVITELPESFCVKGCDDGIKWGKYIQWLNKNYNTDFVVGYSILIDLIMVLLMMKGGALKYHSERKSTLMI